MQLSSEVIHTPPLDSATVIMLRDSDQGPEVFLVRRHGASKVLGGAYVFPGGKLDASDKLLDGHRLLDADDLALHATLAEPQLEASVAKGLFVAAMREAFEESGVLFASQVTPQQRQQLDRLLQGGQNFNQALGTLSIRLRTQWVLPWSRWITPLMPSMTSKRFDTRFFVATVPADQIAQHDSVETTESVWLRPRQALEQYWNGQMEFAPPQIMTLAHLSRHASVADVFAHAQKNTPPVILPFAFDQSGERVICYPGDPLHAVREHAMPGPTRLYFRNRRFEPDAGFEAWFQ